jgi:hypothetical protein
LFRAIRRGVIDAFHAGPVVETRAPEDVPFYRPSGRSHGYLEALDAFRRWCRREGGLLPSPRGDAGDGASGQREPPGPAEVLELHHARGLGLDEASVVLGVERRVVRAQLEAGRRQAERWFPVASRGTAQDLDEALLEAFALEPRRPSFPPAVLAPGVVLGSRYELDRRIGAGAFAEVYRARDLDVPDHVVALKLFRAPAPDEAAARAALRELRHIAAVFHPSIVQFKDHGWHEGRFWFVMPFLEGETLEARIRRGRLDRREARLVFEPLADALAAMHALGVRHQDVKPSNVFLASLRRQSSGPGGELHREDEAPPAGTEGAPALEGSKDPASGGRLEADGVLPMLLDFGVAARDAELVVAGTPSYFAPEVAARFLGLPDPPSVSPKSDVFSLALCLRDALEPDARVGILGGAVSAFVRRRATRSPNAPRGPGLAYLRPSFERWLAHSPDDRPTAAELARELAVLTRPEERRRHLARVARWVIPVTITLVAIFGTLVQWQRLAAQRAEAVAEAQRLDALEARQRAAEIRADLDLVQARRRALEADIARIEVQYRNSRLTRRELAGRLAQRESDLTLVDQRLQTEQRRVRRARERIDELEATVAEGQGEIARLEARADELEGLRAEAVSAGDEARGELGRARERIATLETRVTELEGALAETRDALREARLRALETPFPSRRPSPGGEGRAPPRRTPPR